MLTKINQNTGWASLFLWLLIGFLFSFRKEQPNNNGLQIIHSAGQYSNIIKKAPRKQLVPLNNYLKPYVTHIYYKT